MYRYVTRPLFAVVWFGVFLIATSSGDLRDGLVGYWPLDDLDATDASGNGLDGTLNGLIESTEDRFGNADAAMLFAGFSGDYVDLGDEDAFQISGAMTLAAWVFLDSTNVNNGRVIAKMGGGGSRSWSLNIEAGNFDPTFQISPDGNGVISVSDLDELPSDEWAHLAGVYRPGLQTEVYVNGQLKGVEDLDIPDEQFSENGLPVLIGSRHACGNCGWFGAIDDVAIWDRDLSPAEVMTLYEEGLNGTTLPGDFNGNGSFDAEDIDELALAVRSMSNDVKYDLDGNRMVDLDDHRYWIKDPSIAFTYVGDSNLDREFNSGDFVLVFTAGRYETGEAAGWAEGDWDGDGVFNSSDFVAAFTDGGYEVGPPAAVAAVPEPSALCLLLAMALTGFVLPMRRARSIAEP